MEYLKNNFYVRMLIRTLKEHNMFKKDNFYKLKHLVATIYDNDRISLPHMLIDNLGTLEHKTSIKKTYLELIKNHYINDIIRLISKHKSYSDETINYNTTKIWKAINDGFLCNYLRNNYYITRNSIIENYKFHIFYTEILNKRND